MRRKSKKNGKLIDEEDSSPLYTLARGRRRPDQPNANDAQDNPPHSTAQPSLSHSDDSTHPIMALDTASTAKPLERHR